MSYYGQYTTAYSSASPSYPQPPVGNAYYGSYSAPPAALPPPPAPVYHDAHTFRREFSARLGELTVNSRPIIQGLSIMAHDHRRFADVVAQCLEAHIRRVPPWIKLPAFYLLDMISKNLYEPYARHFATFIIPLFLESYAQVDEGTRAKMDELVLTWRTGSPTGKELFGVSAQISIERGIWGDGSSGAKISSSSGQVTKHQVISEIEFTLGQRERAFQANPYDTTAQNHIAVLQQLRKVVEAGVSQDELKQILAQLHTLVRSSVAPPPPQPQPQPPAPSSASLQWSMQHSSYPSLVPPAGPPAQQGQLPSYPSAASSSTPVPSAPASNISDILSSLVKAGVVSATGTPVGAGKTVNEDKQADLAREAARSYRIQVLSRDVQLTTSAITRTRSHVADILYNRLPAQCKQCGARFADSSLGKKQMEVHLDMHFRQNRKATQSVGRGHSRSWLVPLDDWIHDTSDVKGKGKTSRPLNSEVAAAEEAAKHDEELRSKTVVVPRGDEAKVVSCPICKEVFKSEFLEDDEEWVWKNAVMKDDRVYHATCHAEASTTSLAARLRNDLNSAQSRGSTPESTRPGSVRQSTPLTTANMNVPVSSSTESVLAGTKRKVEDDESLSLSGPIEGTPPAKKVALAA